MSFRTLCNISKYYAADENTMGGVMWCFSLLGVLDMPGATIFNQPLWLQWIAAVSLSALKASICIFLFGLSEKTWYRIVAWILSGIYMLLCAVNAGCYLLYGFGVSHHMMQVVTQTNAREIVEFMPSVVTNIASSVWWIVAAVAVIILIAAAIRRITSQMFGWLAGVLSLFGLVTFVFVAVNMRQGRSAMVMSLRVTKNIVETIRDNRQMELMLAAMRPLPDPESVLSRHNASTVVMVIGESASRGHWSLYDYPLATTPIFDRMRDSLTVFVDAIGSAVTTASNMEHILTLMTDADTTGCWYDYPPLIDLMNAADYKTFWISNQERTGFWSNSSGALSGNADVVKYVGSQNSEDSMLARYDEAVLPEVSLALADTASYKFIGVHLLGSHQLYANRYPKSMSRFSSDDVMKAKPRPWLNYGKASTVAEYDNSIHYTDTLLGCIVAEISRLPHPAIFVYFSDHGENVYDDRDFNGRDRKFVKVPFVIYANAAYRRANPNVMQALRRAAALPVKTSGIAFALMSLTGTEYSRYNSTEDFLSQDYKARQRYVDGRPWSD